MPAAGVRLAGHAAPGAGGFGGGQRRRPVAGGAAVLPGAARSSRWRCGSQPAVLRGQLVMGRDLALRDAGLQSLLRCRRARSRPDSAPPPSPPTRWCCNCGTSWPWCWIRWPSPRSASGRERRCGAGHLAHAKIGGLAASPSFSTAGRGGVRAACSRVGASVLPGRVPRRPLGARRDRGAVVVHGRPSCRSPGSSSPSTACCSAPGDATFMRNATLTSALVGFLPLIWLSLALRLGPARHLVRACRVHGAATGHSSAGGPSPGRWLVAGAGFERPAWPGCLPFMALSWLPQ